MSPIFLSFSVMVRVDLLLTLITIKKTMPFFAFLLLLKTLATNIFIIVFQKSTAKQTTNTSSQFGTQNDLFKVDYDFQASLSMNHRSIDSNKSYGKL